MSGLNSLEKVLTILELFTEDHLEWTPEALMTTLGYTRPTLYRYLKVLREAGLLTSLPGSGFTLGPRVVEMDYLMRKSDPLVARGQRHLETLTARHPCSALLVRWYGERILCVAAECSTPDPLSSYPRGRPMPLTRGAIGRSILAFLPRRQMMAFVEAKLPEFQQVGLGATVEVVAERLRDVRRQGFAVAYGEVTPGVVGIAAPIFDASRVPIASLCVTIGGHLISSDRIAQIGGQVGAASEAISADLAARRTQDEAPLTQSPPRLRERGPS